MLSRLAKRDSSESGRRTFIEMFAGIGLVRLGLEGAGWNCVFANDIDQAKADAYVANLGRDSILVSDIKNVAADHIPDSPLLATASFPCQDLSLAGARAGLNGSRSGTFWHFVSLLASLRSQERHPRLVMIENVPGLITSHQGKDFRAVLNAMNDLGYLCNAALVDARWFVPQSRLRLFIFGVNASSCESVDSWYEDDWARVFSPHRASASEESGVHPPLLARAIQKNHNIKWFPLPELEMPSGGIDPLASLIEPDRDIPREWWYDDEKVERLVKRMSPQHRRRVAEAMGRSRRSVFTGFWRTRKEGPRFEVRFDGIAGCLRTSVGGSSKQSVLLVGRERLKARLLSPRECARLQGVQDDFKLPADRNEAYMGMGDAVAVPAIRWIAENILNPLALQVERCETSELLLR